MAGKGDKRRPLKVDIKQFDSNWDLIFRERKKNEIQTL
jgi:hypothetical protein